MARFARLKNLKNNEYFVLPTRQEIVELPIGEFYFAPCERRVRVRGHYDRSSKKYSYCHFCDISRESFKSGDTLVIVDINF